MFSFWRWQLRAERPAIEHVEHRTIEQKIVSIVDGVALVRGASPFVGVTANDRAELSDVKAGSPED
jgi:hypothetical protein